MMHACKNNAAEIVSLHHFTGNVMFRTFAPIYRKYRGTQARFSKESILKQSTFKEESENARIQLNSLCKGCSKAGKKGILCLVLLIYICGLSGSFFATSILIKVKLRPRETKASRKMPCSHLVANEGN